jgi:hypothetical protein
MSATKNRSTAKKESVKNIEPITCRTYFKRDELNRDDLNILSDLGKEEVLYIPKDCIIGLTEIKNIHKKRLDINNDYKQVFSFPISENSDPVFNVCKKWLRDITESIENLEETRILYKKINIEPVTCYYLSRCIIHLVNILETISEMSKHNPDILKNTSPTYFSYIVDCIVGFKNEFSYFCKELNEYIGELEHINNNLNDISKLFNYAILNMNMINISSPQSINTSIKFIRGVCSDINDLKGDINYLKRSNLRTTYV